MGKEISFSILAISYLVSNGCDAGENTRHRRVLVVGWVAENGKTCRGGNYIASSRSLSYVNGRSSRGYIYVIDDASGIDANATIGKMVPFKPEMEVAYKGGLSTKNVIGAYEISKPNIWIVNPNYAGPNYQIFNDFFKVKTP